MRATNFIVVTTKLAVWGSNTIIYVPCLTVIEWCEKQGMSLDELAILSYHNPVKVIVLPVMCTMYKFAFTILLFMHEDIYVYVHDLRCTEQNVASFSTCVDSIAWDWSDRQLQVAFMNKMCALQHAYCRYVLISYYNTILVLQHHRGSHRGYMHSSIRNRLTMAIQKRYVYNGTQ